jgi:cation diffusion facilitator CzcD-associated flavoprotein CzcO
MPSADIPSHAYQLSFESWTEWSNFYATAPEILKYWQLVAKKYEVEKHIHFSHKCIEARWNEQTCKWTVKVENLDTGLIVEDTGDVLMTGTGTLNDWTWPDIPNLHDFEGPLLHSANWDTSFDAKVSGSQAPA